MNTLNILCEFARVQFWSGSGPTLYNIRFHSKPLLVTVEALKRRSVEAWMPVACQYIPSLSVVGGVYKIPCCDLEKGETCSS